MCEESKACAVWLALLVVVTDNSAAHAARL